MEVWCLLCYRLNTQLTVSLICLTRATAGESLPRQAAFTPQLKHKSSQMCLFSVQKNNILYGLYVTFIVQKSNTVITPEQGHVKKDKALRPTVPLFWWFIALEQEIRAGLNEFISSVEKMKGQLTLDKQSSNKHLVLLNIEGFCREVY